MCEVLTLSYSSGINLSSVEGIQACKYRRFDEFSSVVSYLFKKGNNEYDSNHPTVIVIERCLTGLKSKLDRLEFGEKMLLLKYFFNHLSVIVVDLSSLSNPQIVSSINRTVAKINKLIHDRISRVETWTGAGSTRTSDYFNAKEKNASELWFEIDDIISTMSFVLRTNLNKSHSTMKDVTRINGLIMEEIDFFSLLSDNSDRHLSKLCHLVGHWSFPAHELTNDDLVYCVYLILDYSLKYVKKNTDLRLCADIYFPTPNELLGLVFMVRDTYKNGNPFHNFRHAVDVLQACFHYVIRLQCLPPFIQFILDPKADETFVLSTEGNENDPTELVPNDKGIPNSMRQQNVNNPSSPTPTGTEIPPLSTSTSVNELGTTHLNALQTFALLIAALGHDVGHPGVTNAFMVKYSAPTSLLYNERSVLESYHSAVFINKVLTINWPTLLDLDIDGNTKISLKSLIISCILATDMAEHFEYIDRLASYTADKYILEVNRIKLISSLLIKCADISNVTRPLRVSSQWAMMLGREFNEVAILEEKLSCVAQNPQPNFHYDRVPSTLPDILNANPDLHKGQIFFINTFAENLFNNIAELLPELSYTCSIIQENKDFWMSRA